MVIGLALTFVGLAFVGAIVIRIVDPDNFPSLGLAIWWALQTVTTVGYGDVVPTTTMGRVIGGIEMVLGISFITFLTAGVTSIVIQRGSAKAQAVERAHDEHDAKTILDALIETRQAITELDARLDRIESKITAERVGVPLAGLRQQIPYSPRIIKSRSASKAATWATSTSDGLERQVRARDLSPRSHILGHLLRVRLKRVRASTSGPNELKVACSAAMKVVTLEGRAGSRTGGMASRYEHDEF